MIYEDPVPIMCPECGDLYLGWPHQEAKVCVDCYTDKEMAEEEE